MTTSIIIPDFIYDNQDLQSAPLKMLLAINCILIDAYFESKLKITSRELIDAFDLSRYELEKVLQLLLDSKYITITYESAGSIVHVIELTTKGIEEFQTAYTIR